MSEFDGKGYQLPDVVEPPDLTCFRVYVPKDSLYIAAFWGAYEFFTTWLAWARDPLKRGRLAARAWRVAFNKARAEYEQSNGVCEMNITGIRQNPLNACELQAEFDGNNQWVTVADLSKCSSAGGGSLPAMRYDGVNIQIYNSCDGDWENAGDPTTPVIQPYTPPFPDSPTNGKCLSATAFAMYEEAVKNTLADIVIGATTVGTVGVGLTALLADWFGITVAIEAVLIAATDLFTTTKEHADDAKLVDITDDLQCIGFLFFANDGTVTQDDISHILIEVGSKRDSYANNTGEWAAWNLVYRSLSFMTQATAARAVKGWLPDTADCSGCGWRQEFNFREGKNGWVIGDGSYDAIWGKYFDGIGFKSAFVTSPNGGYRRTDIKILFDSTTITGIHMDFDETNGALELDGAILFVDYPDIGGTHLYNQPQPTIQGGVFEVTQLSLTTTGLYIGLQSGAKADFTDPGGEGIIYKVVLTGNGRNPFI